MDKYLIIIILILLFINILLLFILNKNNECKENFEIYSYGPFNYMDSGADPLTFYKYPIYRRPYMYPYKFYSSFPYPYMTYYPTNI
jgi:hypothetical protein